MVKKVLASAALVAAFTTRWHRIRDHKMGRLDQLGSVRSFKKLHTRCAKHGLKPCTSLCCKEPIKPLSEFARHGKRTRTFCRTCTKGGGKAATAASAKKKLKRKHDEEADPEALIAGHIEDEAMKWLVGLLKACGFEVAVTPEFRRADAAVRWPKWPAGVWLPLQIKSDGVYRKDGTRKPNDSKDGSGSAGFKCCLNYEDMLLVCIKSRFDAKGDVVRSVWVCRGYKAKTNDLGESKDGVLAPQGSKIPRLSDPASGLKKAIRKAPASFRRSWFSIFTEIDDWKQRKEATIMLALCVAGFDVSFPTGFQSVIDCFLEGTLAATQVKTYNIKGGYASTHHRFKGHNNRPYRKSDGIATLLEGVIVESRGRYYLLYAHQPNDAVLEHGVFAHEGYRGLSESTGMTSISPPLGIFREWLTGKAGEQEDRQPTAWLRQAAFGFRPPVELTEEKAREVGLPWQWVVDAATPAALPSAFPSDGQLEALATRVSMHEAELAYVSRARVAQPEKFANVTTTDMLRRLRVRRACRQTRRIWRQRRRNQ